MSQSDLFGDPSPALAPTPAAASNLTLAALREEAKGCTACDLYRNATQTVFGEGPEDAEVMFVGEQPGDQEDRQGRPFVGPAGQLFDRALAEAGIDRARCYLTNAVKHFKFEPRGKRRIHAKPDTHEIAVCSSEWLDKELAVLRPRIVVALGASAGQGLLRRKIAVLKERGRRMKDPRGFDVLLTVHPSFLLRLPDPAQQEGEFRRFVGDLMQVAA